MWKSKSYNSKLIYNEIKKKKEEINLQYKINNIIIISYKPTLSKCEMKLNSRLMVWFYCEILFK